MRTILVPLDGSSFSEHALPAAIALARRAGARLALAHVHQVAVPAVALSGELMFDPTTDGLIRSDEQRYLDGLGRRLAEAGVTQVSMELLEAPVALALGEHARAIGADLLVLTTHGRGGLARAWLGSVTDQLIRQSPVPVLALHADEGPVDLAAGPSLDHILIPLDGSKLAEEAIPVALRLGQLSAARYTLAQVVPPVMHGFYIDGASPYLDTAELEERWQQTRAYLKRVAEPLRAEGLFVDCQAPVGQPAEALLTFAHEHAVDLIALTTHGRGGIARLLLGSVADKLVRGSSVPLLVARPHAADMGADAGAAS